MIVFIFIVEPLAVAREHAKLNAQRGCPIAPLQTNAIDLVWSGLLYNQGYGCPQYFRSKG
jgi:hypothetical protein